MALQVDGDDRVPVLFGHAQEVAVAEDAGAVDEDIEPPEAVDGGLDDALAAFDRRDAVEVGDGAAARRQDLVDDVLRRAAARARCRRRRRRSR